MIGDRSRDEDTCRLELESPADSSLWLTKTSRIKQRYRVKGKDWR